MLGTAFQLSAQSSTPVGSIIRTVAGTDFTFTIPGGRALHAPFGRVFEIALDSSGNVYAADFDNSVVVKVAPNGTGRNQGGRDGRGPTRRVSFAGLAPGVIGVYQVKVIIPSGVTPGDNVRVVLTEGSQVSQPVIISAR
ncbi:MAG TPA: hypothetical protein VGZ73_13565 [Bryobacteraceae bacterium]|nr:hypothetical protein [Bryobacteraceae bacterium]